LTPRYLKRHLHKETQVFGKLNDLFVKGVIDENQINDGVLEIYEEKIRKS